MFEYIERYCSTMESLGTDISECTQYSELKQEIVMCMERRTRLHMYEESSIVLEYIQIW
jgi:hypothetical protein